MDRDASSNAMVISELRDQFGTISFWDGKDL